MRIAKINFYGSSQVTDSNWNNKSTSNTITNMIDTSLSATAWDYIFNAGNPSYQGFNGGTGYLGGVTGSGAAAWVDSQTALREGIGFSKSVGWYATTISGLDPAKQYEIEIFGSVDSTNRILEFRCNGGAPASLNCHNNSTLTAIITSVSPNGSGEILLEIRGADASSGIAYANAMRISELDTVTQDFTVTQSSVKPSDTISGTYAGWPTTPAASLVLTDSASNTLTLTPTVVGGAGNGTWSATVPALPTAGSDVELLKFGATTVSFGGFTAKTGPTLQVATTQTLATLASGFDDYVFQGWSPQPTVGDQLVTVTDDGVFNSNGDYTFYAEGVYPVWYVDGTGQVYGRTIDTSGLNDVVVTPAIDPESGTYSTPVTVAITTATDGATLRYTTDGSDVTSGSTLYSAPFSVTDDATVKARGFKEGMTDSAQASQTYVINSTAITGVEELSPWQAEYTHALSINQIIDATGINVVKVSVQQQEYIYALKVNEIITALGLPIKLLSVQQQSFMTALTINQIINALEAVVYGLNFNKSSIYGTLANRVIDVTGDIEIEFYTPDYIGTAGFSQSIVAQCAASTFTAQEFELYFSGGSGNLVVNIGGAITSVLLSGTFTASTQYRIVLSGSTSTVYNMAGGVVRTVALNRGAAREPAAAVTIGARFNGTSMVEYFGGVQRDLKINGVLWPMSSRDQAVQPSTPTGNSMTITGATSGDWVLVS